MSECPWFHWVRRNPTIRPFADRYLQKLVANLRSLTKGMLFGNMQQHAHRVGRIAIRYGDRQETRPRPKYLHLQRRVGWYLRSLSPSAAWQCTRRVASRKVMHVCNRYKGLDHYSTFRGRSPIIWPSHFPQNKQSRATVGVAQPNIPGCRPQISSSE
jgi:hypothetical protein